jgi:glutathionyl-hydroquinone reductase
MVLGKEIDSRCRQRMIKEGLFARPHRFATGLHRTVTGPTGAGDFKAEKGRYRLYIDCNCPRTSRTLMARTLKRIEVTVFNPRLTDQGWQFGGYPGADGDEDTLNGTRYMHNCIRWPIHSFRARHGTGALGQAERDHH